MNTPSSLADRPVWLAWTGMETDLIFNKGYDLPGFAAFPMLDSAEGREKLVGYYTELIAIGRDTGSGVLLDTPTWMANPDRAADLGHGPEALLRFTRDGISLARSVAQAHADVISRVSVQIGPRGDGYSAGIATVDEAAAYHAPQIRAAVEGGADVVSAYTLGSAGEAIGIAQAAREAGISALISYTVETDGRLADGTPLGAAVARLADEGAPMAILVNCAHPEHIARGLDGGAWQNRLAGIVANASRQSHAELDNAEELDDGDPVELGGQLAKLRQDHAGINVLGGCCGTDLRHIRQIAEQAMRGL